MLVHRATQLGRLVAASAVFWGTPGCEDPASLTVEVALEELMPSQLTVSVSKGGPDEAPIINCTFERSGAVSAGCPFEGGERWGGEPLEFVLYGRPDTPLWLDVRGDGLDERARVRMPVQLPAEPGASDRAELRLSTEATEQARCTAPLPDGASTTLLAVTPVPTSPNTEVSEPAMFIATVDDQLVRYSIRRDAEDGCGLEQVGQAISLGCTPRAGSIAALRRNLMDIARGLLVTGLCEGGATDKLWLAFGAEGGALNIETFEREVISSPVIVPVERGVQIRVAVQAAPGVARLESIEGGLLASGWTASTLGALPAGSEPRFEPQVRGFFRNRRPYLVISGVYGKTGLFGELGASAGCTEAQTGASERFCMLRDDDRPALSGPLVIDLDVAAMRLNVAVLERVPGALVRTQFMLRNDNPSVESLDVSSRSLALSDEGPAVLVGQPDGLTQPPGSVQALISDGAQVQRATVFDESALPPEQVGHASPAGLLMANLDGRDGEDLLSYSSDGRLSLWSPQGGPINNWWVDGQGALSAILVGGAVANLELSTARIVAARGGLLTVINLGRSSYVQTRFSWPMERRDAWGLGVYKSSRDPLRVLPE